MRVHFTGIGGIGMSALAQYYIAKGHHITGTDLHQSEITRKLKELGAKIRTGKHLAGNLSSKTDLLIFSPAIDSGNPEIKKAKKLGIKIQSYPQALGDLTKKYHTIAVSGTHGKSTTSAMIAVLLESAGFDPTVIIGTKVKSLNDSNFRMGSSKYLVIEADEYKESFLNYNPFIMVLTNIEKDHLDYFKNIENILKAFKKYILKIDDRGIIIANKNDANVKKVLKSRKNVGFFSIDQKEAKKIKEIIKIPGEHNLYNALAAFETARFLGIKEAEAYRGIAKFKGAWRRFEVFKKKGYVLISDYAHHPTEIEKTLATARNEFPNKKIKLVYQPHQYKRTQMLFRDFVKVFKNAPVDEIVLCEVYEVAGREEKGISKKFNSQKLVEAINDQKVIYKRTLKNAKDHIKNNLKKGEVLIIMGAGDIYELFLEIRNLIDKKRK